MSDSDIVEWLRERYKKNGIEGLSYPSIKKVKGLYFNLYNRGLTQKKIIALLGLEQEYKEYKLSSFDRVVNGKVQSRWTWARVIEEAEPIVEEQGFLPPAQWFTANGHGSLVQYVYSVNKNWGDLRSHFDSFESSQFVVSRNGMRWRSRPEASFSNFLYARGIEHKPGEKYAVDYSDFGDASYGYYDLHFRDVSGKWVDVEIWGDKPNGHNEGRYAEVREAKESFNESNPRFLGVHYKDCYEESKLSGVLERFIGNVAPFVFDKPVDRLVQTTHWSDADELITYCKVIADSQPNGLFPTEEWLRKRGKWADREGPAYNTVSVYIKQWLGGVRRLREILGQSEASTKSWDRESALAAYKEFFDRHGFTPRQATTTSRKVSPELKREAARIGAAVLKYVGSVAIANELSGITPRVKSKWSRETILAETLRLFKKYQLTPLQLARKHSSSDVELFKISAMDTSTAKKIADAASRHFSGWNEIYSILEIQQSDIRVVRRQQREARR